MVFLSCGAQSLAIRLRTYLNAELLFPTGRNTAEAYERLERLEDWVQGEEEQGHGTDAASPVARQSSQQVGKDCAAHCQ